MGPVAPQALRELAGTRFFNRGGAYFAAGAVRSLRPSDRAVTAVVQGSRRYRVRLWAEGGEFEYDCTCPVGRDGAFCKHCVAVGLAWHAGAGVGEDRAGVTADTDAALGDAGLHDHLMRLDKEDLVDLLVEHADEDERLHRRLTLRAARATSGSAEPSVWKKAFDEAVGTDHFVHYREAYDHFSGIEEVIESLEDFMKAGEAAKVIGLAEHGLAEIEESLAYVDDSDGWIGGLLGRLQELHLEACRRARPDPAELAERLFEGEMESAFDTFHRAALVYAEILGEAGLAAYRRLAEAEWAKVRALGPGDEDPERYGGRYRITSIMEGLAEAAGDLEALVAVKTRDLSSPHAFLQIASLYQKAGDPGRALDWAERGWRAFSGGRRDARLRAFIADCYQDRGRRDEAMNLIWDAFVEYPGLDTYRQLKGHGRRAKQWPDWRERALAEIRRRVADGSTEPPGHRRPGHGPSRDHSLLVEIFLHEGDSETAWHEAETGGCSQRLWLELAKRREATHPEDSIRIYKAHVAALLRDTGERVYKEAVARLEKIGTLLNRSGGEAAFLAFLTDLRATHKRKRKLMQMLDRKGW